MRESFRFACKGNPRKQRIVVFFGVGCLPSSLLFATPSHNRAKNCEIEIRLFSLESSGLPAKNMAATIFTSNLKREEEGNGVNTLFHPTLVYGYFNAKWTLKRSQINPMKNQERIDSSPSKNITVLLVEDHLHCRVALKHLLESSDDIKIIGEAKDGREAVRLTKSLLPEVVVMDISMPLLNGIEATRQIIENLPKSRVLILSAHSEVEYIEQAMMCGASGYLIKQSSTHMLAEAVREVGMGNSFFCSPVPKPLRDKCRKLFGKSKSPKKKATLLACRGTA